MGFPGGSVVKNLPASAGIQEMQVRSLGWEDTLKKEMATHSSIVALEIPWTEEPGGTRCSYSTTATITRTWVPMGCSDPNQNLPQQREEVGRIRMAILKRALDTQGINLLTREEAQSLLTGSKKRLRLLKNTSPCKTSCLVPLAEQNVWNCLLSTSLIIPLHPSSLLSFCDFIFLSR